MCGFDKKQKLPIEKNSIKMQLRSGQRLALSFLFIFQQQQNLYMYNIHCIFSFGPLLRVP